MGGQASKPAGTSPGPATAVPAPSAPSPAFASPHVIPANPARSAFQPELDARAGSTPLPMRSPEGQQSKADALAQHSSPNPYTTVLGTKTDVVPQSMVGKVAPVGGQVFMRGVPETEEEEEQLRYVQAARNQCRINRNWTWEAFKYAEGGILAGFLFRALLPLSKWHPAFSWGPVVFGAAVGSIADLSELQRHCDAKFPLPRWTIERARPLAQMSTQQQQMHQLTSRSPALLPSFMPPSQAASSNNSANK